MSIIAAVRFILLPFLLWQAKRRSKRDNRFTITELEAFHHQLHHRKP